MDISVSKHQDKQVGCELVIDDYKINQEKYKDNIVLAVYVLQTMRNYGQSIPISYQDIIDALEHNIDGYKFNFYGFERNTIQKRLQKVMKSLTRAGFVEKVKSRYIYKENILAQMGENNVDKEAIEYFKGTIFDCDEDKNAMLVFDSLMRSRFIDNDIKKVFIINDCMSKYDNEKFSINHYKSIFFNTIAFDREFLQRLFILLKAVGKQNVKFSYLQPNYSYRTFKLSPYEIVFYDNRYYLIGKVYSTSRKVTELSHFRIDLMEDVLTSKKTEFISIKTIGEDIEISEDEINAERVFKFYDINHQKSKYEYLLYRYVLDNIVGKVLTVEFTSTNPFVLSESDIVMQFGDAVRVNRKTHTYTLTNYPQDKFIDWAMYNIENLIIKTEFVNGIIKNKHNEYAEIEAVEEGVERETCYSVKLNIKDTSFNYRKYGVLESRSNKQIIIKCTLEKLKKLAEFIRYTKQQIVASDSSNFGKIWYASRFHDYTTMKSVVDFDWEPIKDSKPNIRKFF